MTNTLQGSTVERLEFVADRAIPATSVSSVDLRRVAVDHVVYAVQLACVRLCESSVDPLIYAEPSTLSVDQRLERAAVVYRLALVLRRNATEDVAADLGVSRATAGRLVRECRDRGLLGDPAVIDDETKAAAKVAADRMRKGTR